MKNSTTFEDIESIMDELAVWVAVGDKIEFNAEKNDRADIDTICVYSICGSLMKRYELNGDLWHVVNF